MIAVSVLAPESCLASSVAITYDVLATANRISAVAQRPPPFLVSTAQLARPQDRRRQRRADLIIVPGLGIDNAEQLVDWLCCDAGQRARRFLVKAASAGSSIAASCASTFLVAETGLLNGRRATTTWWLAPLFQRRYPEVDLVSDQIVVADWPIATGGAAMAQMDLMLAVVGRFAGVGLSKACANYLLLDERRSQAPFMAIGYLAGQDPKIAQAESWVRKNVGRDFNMRDLAASVALAPRTFARRLDTVCGTSPIQFVQRIRLEKAKFLLQTTRLPIDEIGRRVGYSDASMLRRLVRRDSKLSPHHLRP